MGIKIYPTGDLRDLKVFTDAGFAGEDSKAQSGSIISWGDAVIGWRSSKQTVAALSTAEAELNTASLSWAIAEGLRALLEEWDVEIPRVQVDPFCWCGCVYPPWL